MNGKRWVKLPDPSLRTLLLKGGSSKPFPAQRLNSRSGHLRLRLGNTIIKIVAKANTRYYCESKTKNICSTKLSIGHSIGNAQLSTGNLSTWNLRLNIGNNINPNSIVCSKKEGHNNCLHCLGGGGGGGGGGRGHIHAGLTKKRSIFKLGRPIALSKRARQILKSPSSARFRYSPHCLMAHGTGS